MVDWRGGSSGYECGDRFYSDRSDSRRELMERYSSGRSKGGGIEGIECINVVECRGKDRGGEGWDNGEMFAQADDDRGG
ncbi:hypothetical protein Tco_0908533 [Tanacetum coccineum]|uniref:Uncharacterized protein n=1 Tax=Tanacetum coccineum TaxID=301880 RepID=A0ABQ5CQP6_9ASTR